MDDDAPGRSGVTHENSMLRAQQRCSDDSRPIREPGSPDPVAQVRGEPVDNVATSN